MYIEEVFEYELDLLGTRRPTHSYFFCVLRIGRFAGARPEYVSGTIMLKRPFDAQSGGIAPLLYKKVGWAHSYDDADMTVISFSHLPS